MRYIRAMILCLMTMFTSCLFSLNEYTLYLIIDGAPAMEANSPVTLEGKEVGRIEGTVPLDGKKLLLKLRIQKGFDIPRSDEIVCRESILGGTYVDIHAEKKAPGHAYYQPKDTLHGKYEPLHEITDTAGQRVILQRLQELGNTVDSLRKRLDSAHK